MSLEKSEKALASMDLEKVFRRVFPRYLRHYKASVQQDRAGTDYYVVTETVTVQVDMKVLSRDPGWKSGWSSCLPIELWSVKDRWICGYDGNADFVLWVYRDSNRVVLARRKELRDYVNLRRLEWMFFLKEYESQTRSWNGTIYTSSFVWLPFFVVAKQGFFYQYKVA
ncbi:hypothetical protein [Pelagicoccus sp. SDUM812005]|uniref:hypothetical protein n=1 Tax=Pelagicoccus sp. SDUM812005 TaxID=3041257 RepID=UPI00280E4B2F|nr:hypothetical protein [Pelagicoccus sp. SDUM812005]MDQ8182206.1 hypothetical protein [Pelagicoccus sp. SDUM812005]